MPRLWEIAVSPEKPSELTLTVDSVLKVLSGVTVKSLDFATGSNHMSFQTTKIHEHVAKQPDASATPVKHVHEHLVDGF